MDWKFWLTVAVFPFIFLLMSWVWKLRSNELTHIQAQLDRIEGMLVDHLKWHAENK